MDYRTQSAVLGLFVIGVLAALGIASFVDSFALQTAETLLAPTIGSIVLVAVVVGSLVALGSRSRRWLANPYW
ncbi:hypothetical protein HALLA_10810 [Halostagnicola larsenii XH-48]|uniref:Major facilitator superfamily (MFS) profile domain-containing protein n=1 Tax=Halostagnicola larsenii XH-48 TaxID=797299 RepID=W0JQ41_9EURY|nr:hypothetical protein [Halostagnicola larsenii]AHF99274.1 hypothetical protein HALLA_10810 [Halostagnicola larsenii XH-48]